MGKRLNSHSDDTENEDNIKTQKSARTTNFNLGEHSDAVSLINIQQKKRKHLSPSEMMVTHKNFINPPMQEDAYNLKAAVMRGIKASGHSNYLGAARSQTAMMHKPQTSVSSAGRPKTSFQVDN